MRIVVLGAKGRLGAALVHAWNPKHDVVALARPEIDLANLEGLRNALETLEFDAVVNCAAFTAVDACETRREYAFTVNAAAPKVIGAVCALRNKRLIHISTDYVFDGEKREPYTEEDPANPRSLYAESKYLGEAGVLESHPSHIVARVSWVFGPHKPSFVDMILERAQTNDHVDAVADKWSSPTYTLDLANWLDALLQPKIEGGIYHLCNSGAATWQEYGQLAIDCAKKAGVRLRTTQVEPIRLADMKAFVAPRGVYSAMATGKFTAATGVVPAPWQDAVRRYVSLKFSSPALGGGSARSA